MAKTSTAAMDTHLAQEVTTLAVAGLIERTDGQIFRVTTSSEDVTIDVGDGNGDQLYLADEGVARTNIANDAELNVDNMDVLGVFDNAALDETELRRGLFDFADFKLFVFNYNDTSPTMGIVKMFRGEFGEVTVTKQGTFKVTVRSIVQVFSKETGESYTKDCKADLGDIRCRVPVFPDPDNPNDRSFPVSNITPNVAYQLGDFVIIPTSPENNDCALVQMNFEGVDGATSGPGFVNQGTHIDPTINGSPEIDTAQTPAGGDSISSLLFDGSTDFLSWPDAAVLQFGSNEVTIHGHFRLNAVGALQTIASKFDATGNQREWVLRTTVANVLEFVGHDDGTATADFTLTGTTGLTTGVNYHVAVVRKSNGDWELFLDGTSEAGPTTPTGNIFDGTAPLRIGVGDGGTTDFFNGWIDSFEVVNGFARWEANFTAPTGNLSNTNTALNWEDFGDRLYEVTTAGTSGVCINTPDTTISNTHTQGSAVLTANHSWMRFAQVLSVDSGSPRRIFTVTQLTPNSGQTVGANRTPSALGFPDDWFNGGAAFFDTGDNAGVAEEVRDFTADDGITIEQDIELFEDLPFDIQVGDKLRIFPGCDKTNPVCIAKFNNGPNFVGEPYVPGEDILGQYPDAR